jgi:hypothetical protein
MALPGTAAAVLVTLGSGSWPASAALRGNGAAVQSPTWPSGLPMLVVATMLAVCWTASALAAAHRSGKS